MANPTEPFIRKLLEDKTWDRAIITLKDTSRVAIGKSSTFSVKEGVLSITDTDSIDPFYDARKDGPQPKLCTMEITTRTADIALINYIQYPKIISSPNSKGGLIVGLTGNA